jgi:hypothetical protein
MSTEEPLKRATAAQLESLHGTLAKHFAEVMEKGVRVLVKNSAGEQEIAYIDAPPALVNAARQFLKDNGIEGAALDDKTKTTLADKLAEMAKLAGEDDGASPFSNVSSIHGS